jgi:Mg-chelatase subunit ChlD
MPFLEKSAAFFSLFVFAAQPVLGPGGFSCQQRTVIATVADARGVVPEDLTSDNFSVSHRGRAAPLLSATYSKRPRRVVVLLDVSGSMSSHEPGRIQKWEVARAAAWEFFAALPLGSKAGLTTFSEKAEIQTTLSSDLRPIQIWLNGETARHPESFYGRTALYAAVQSAVSQLQPTEPGDAIYVITDGGENASRMSESKLEGTLGLSGVRLFVLIVPRGAFVGEEERIGLAELLEISKRSGGFVEVLGPSINAPLSDRLAFYDDHMKERITHHSQQFSLEIEAFYLLTLQFPENPEKNQHLDINVVDARGSSRKDLSVAYPRKLSACGIESAQR